MNKHMYYSHHYIMVSTRGQELYCCFEFSQPRSKVNVVFPQSISEQTEVQIGLRERKSTPNIHRRSNLDAGYPRKVCFFFPSRISQVQVHIQRQQLFFFFQYMTGKVMTEEITKYTEKANEQKCYQSCCTHVCILFRGPLFLQDRAGHCFSLPPYH